MRNLVGGKRNFASCRPFDGADQETLKLRDFEVRVCFVAPGVAKHRRVDAAFAVAANPVHGFVSPGVFAVSEGEDVKVF